MGIFTRRRVGLGGSSGDHDGAAVCRMFSQATVAKLFFWSEADILRKRFSDDYPRESLYRVPSILCHLAP